MAKAQQNAPEMEPDGALRELTKEELFEIKEEVHRVSEDLGIPLEEATRMVYEERGIHLPERTKVVESLSDLVPGMRNVSIRARIISIQRMERKSGTSYYRGYLGDAGSEIRYTAWVQFPFEPNTPVFIQNVSVREWNEKVEVVINDNSFVSPIEDTEGLLPRIEEGVPSTISELRKDSREVDVEVRIVESREARVNSKGKQVDIVKGIIADRTGRMSFTCWGPMNIKEAGCYRIIGGYVKEFKGQMDLNLSPGSIFRPLSEDRLPSIEELMRPEDSRIINLVEGKFSGPVYLRGTVLSIRSGSGLFQKCLDCGRRLNRGTCTVHGKTKGEWDLGFKGIFDDGSATAFLRGDRIIVESILGSTVEEITEEIKESLDPEVILGRLEDDLLGKPITIIADPVLDDYGVTLQVSGIEMGWEMEKFEREIISLLEVIA
jgi:replication factor A1